MLSAFIATEIMRYIFKFVIWMKNERFKNLWSRAKDVDKFVELYKSKFWEMQI